MCIIDLSSVVSFSDLDFLSDDENDRYTCPAGQYLTKGKVRSDRRDTIDHYRNLTACPTCALKPRCTLDKIKRVKRWEHEGVLDKMQARLDRMREAMTIRDRKSVGWGKRVVEGGELGERRLLKKENN